MIGVAVARARAAHGSLPAVLQGGLSGGGSGPAAIAASSAACTGPAIPLPVPLPAPFSAVCSAACSCASRATTAASLGRGARSAPSVSPRAAASSTARVALLPDPLTRRRDDFEPPVSLGGTGGELQ